RSKTCARCSGGIPMPWSRTTSCIAAGSGRVSSTSIGPPSGLYLIALSTRLVMTCSKRTGSIIADVSAAAWTQIVWRGLLARALYTAAVLGEIAAGNGTCDAGHLLLVGDHLARGRCHLANFVVRFEGDALVEIAN